jgi:organic radical activating enzyme
MNLISVHNNWRDEVLSIDLNLGNFCNYKCWYCWPGSNAGTHKFPNIDVIKKNISHFINYYKEHTNKKVFDIHFCGGEPTHWKDLPEFIKFLKENFNCLISMTSNGSKKIDWWKQNAKYFDRIHLSCHREFVNIIEYRDLCDYLYDQKVIVSVSVMMDPLEWNQCSDIVEYLKGSRRQWTIRYVEIIDPTVSYTEEQKKILAKHRARGINLWFFWRHNKYYRSTVTAVDENGSKYKLQDNEILLKRLNNFYGWECSLGVNWVHISSSGVITGTCNQFLYGTDYHFNLYNPNFNEEFKPNIVPTICKKSACVCNIETVMPKKKPTNIKRVIPIYAN